MTATSRERVRAFLARSHADRVPINYAANGGIDARLKQHFRLAAHDDEGLRLALGVDFRCVGPDWRGGTLHAAQPGVTVNAAWGYHTRWIEHASGGYFDFCDFPLREADLEAVAAWALPDADHYDYSALPHLCAAYDSFGLHLGNPGLADILNGTGALMGMERVYAALAGDDPAWNLLVERRLAHELATTERSLAACNGRIDVVWVGEDLGSQRGPLCSLATWRRVLRPWHQRMVEIAQVYGAAVMLHSCGASSPFFDDLIAMGVCAIDTLQPDAAGMEALRVKQGWGDRLAFHGGVGTGGIVANGTADEARTEAERVLEAYMPNGGYAFSPAHALQDNTPLDNVLAIYQAAHSAGQYARSAA